jgi:hypothetical protein
MRFKAEYGDPPTVVFLEHEGLKYILKVSVLVDAVRATGECVDGLPDF